MSEQQLLVPDQVEDELAARRRQVDWQKTIGMAKHVALAGLPLRRSRLTELNRVWRAGHQRWVRVTYKTSQGPVLPYGLDRFVLAGLMDKALRQRRPVISFDGAGELLRMFGLADGGAEYDRLRERLSRVCDLSIAIGFATSEAGLEIPKTMTRQEKFGVAHICQLPTRSELRSRQAPLPLLWEGEEFRFGVQLDTDFFNYILEQSNSLWIPAPLLSKFVGAPSAWDLLILMVQRCGAASREHSIPHEALVAMMQSCPGERDAKTIGRIRGDLQEVIDATNGELQARLVDGGKVRKGSRGPATQRWNLVIQPGRLSRRRGAAAFG